MKASEVSLGQTVYVEFDKGSTHIGIVVKIKNSRIFCGTPTIKYYDIDMDAIHETSLENVYPSLISLFEVKLKKMEEEQRITHLIGVVKTLLQLKSHINT